MQSPYLTPEELYDLTHCKQKKRQVKWLRRYRWVHEVSDTGEPRVLRTYWDQRLRGKLFLQKKVAEPPRFDKLKVILDRGRKASIPGGN